MFWLLIRLRYQLIWAQARTSGGKVALLSALYVCGGALMVLVATGGFGTAASASAGGGEEVARWLFDGLFVGGLVSSVALGAGPRKAFSEAALRRYPLTCAQRFAVRHLTGLLDPTWLLTLAASLGLSAGFVVAGSSFVLEASTAALLFVVACYLTAVLLLALIDRALHMRGGATLVNALIFALFTSSGCVVVVLLGPGNRAWLPALDQLSVFTPPGAAAALLFPRPATSGAAQHAAFLVAWCAVAVLSLMALERRLVRASRANVERGVIRWDGLLDALARGAGRHAPLVGKALRYQLRCHRVLFNLIAAALLVAFAPTLIARDKGPDEFVGAAVFVVFFAGALATHAVAFNHFGYDGAGIRRYAILPVPFVAATRASSYASLLLTAAALLPGIGLWTLVSGVHLDARTLSAVSGGAVAGGFFFGALGLWTTALTPRRADFQGIVGNQLSRGGLLVVVGGGLVAAVVATVLTRAGDWLTPALLAVAAAVCYAVSHQLVACVLASRREHIINVIAGAESN
jgi:hypothetical protein